MSFKKTMMTWALGYAIGLFFSNKIELGYLIFWFLSLRHLILISLLFFARHTRYKGFLIATAASFWAIIHNPSVHTVSGEAAACFSQPYTTGSIQRVVVQENDAYVLELSCGMKTNICKALAPLPSFLLNGLHVRPWPTRELIGYLTLGEGACQDKRSLDLFRSLGISHLIVISGLHFSQFKEILSSLCLLPLRLLYLLSYLTPRSLEKIRSKIKIMIICLLGFYLTQVLYSSASAQRAFVFCLTTLFYQHYAYTQTLTQYILLAFSLQTFLFPIATMSFSNMMSWAAYLTIYYHLGCYPAPTTTVSNSIWRILHLQVCLSVITLFTFDSLNLWSIPFNLFLLPLMPVLLVLSVMIVTLPSFGFISLLAGLTYCVSILSWLSEHLPTVEISFKDQLEIKLALGLFIIGLVVISKQPKS